MQKVTSHAAVHLVVMACHDEARKVTDTCHGFFAGGVALGQMAINEVKKEGA